MKQMMKKLFRRFIKRSPNNTITRNKKNFANLARMMLDAENEVNTAATIMATIRGIEKGAGTRKALKALFYEIDKELKARHFETCNRVINSFDPYQDNHSLILGILTVLHPAKENIRGFDSLRDRFAEALESKGRDSEKLLKQFFDRRA